MCKYCKPGHCCKPGVSCNRYHQSNTQTAAPIIMPSPATGLRDRLRSPPTITKSNSTTNGAHTGTHTHAGHRYVICISQLRQRRARITDDACHLWQNSPRYVIFFNRSNKPFRICLAEQHTLRLCNALATPIGTGERLHVTRTIYGHFLEFCVHAYPSGC